MSDTLAFLFGGKTKARILELLLSHPGQSYHLRGLAQAAGTDSGNTARLLRSLVDNGLVLAAPDSHSTRYAINTRSALMPPLRELVANAGALIKDLRGVAEGLATSYVGVYGSFAAGTDEADSDIDVLIVGELSVVAAQAAFKAVGRKHRKQVNVVVVSAGDLRHHLQENSALWSSIANGKKIDLKGAWSDVA
jgi:predicted nucleotidyltransferase